MTAAIVIPARLESTRLPRKLLLDRTGRTVLEHSIERALAARERNPALIRRVLVACDDPKLIEAARRGGAEAVLTRTDHACGSERIAEAAAGLSESIVVNLQADEPELEPAVICQVAELLQDAKARVQMATLAVPIFEEGVWRNPAVVKVVIDALGRALYFSRAPIPFIREPDSAPQPWVEADEAGVRRRVYGLQHLGLYAYRRRFLLSYPKLPQSKLEGLERLEQLRALEAGHQIQVGLTRSSPPGIDTLEAYEGFVARCSARKAGAAVERGKE